jgi:hypothetical protein
MNNTQPTTPTATAERRPPNPRYLEMAQAAIAEPFKGITADGHVVPGLFPLTRTGVPTTPVREAAEAFLATLSTEQRARTTFPVDTIEWRKWSNIHRTLMRHGLSMGEMSPAQRARAYDLLRASLSWQGFETARSVMWLNEYVAELTDRPEEYGEGLYWLSIMGTPSEDAPWGWQIDGHHLNLNCFILGDQMVMTPAFIGSEPVSTDTGKYAGTSVLLTEEREGLAFMRTLSAQQQRKATLGMELPPDVFTTGFRDNFEMRYEGLPWPDLSSAQQQQLLRLTELYIGRMRPGHAQVKMEEIRRHLADTYFAWIGGTGDESVFYYRIHSPVVLIEFDHQRGLVLPSEEHVKYHIHTVVRTPNGNDYGKDLLRQHYEQVRHP